MEEMMLYNSTNMDDNYCYFCADPAWVIFKLAFGGLVVILNAISLIGLLRYKELNMSLKYSFTILSFSDTLMGISYLYDGFVSFFKDAHDIECKVRFWFLGMGSFMALATVGLLSFDRLLSLEFPLKYSACATKKVLLVTTFVCWIVIFIGVTWTVGKFQDFIWCDILDLLSPEGFILMTVSGILVIFVTIIFNLRILVLARRQISKILPTILQQDRTTTAIKLNTKTIVTTAAVLVPFVLCTMPMHIYFLVVMGRPDLITRTYAPDLMEVVLFFQLLNSFFNPFIYIWRLPELRHHIKKMVACHGR